MRTHLSAVVVAMFMGVGCGESTSPDGMGSGEPVSPPGTDAGPAEVNEDDGSAAPDASTETPRPDAADPEGSPTADTPPGAGGSSSDAGASDSADEVREDPVTGGLGSACSADGDCDGDLSCYGVDGGPGEEGDDVTRFPRGYCTTACGFTDSFEDSDRCGGSGSCVLLGDTREMVCALECASDADCRPDYSCQRARSWPEEGRYCLPAPEGPSGDPRDEGDRGDGGDDGSGVGEDGDDGEEERTRAETGSPCARDADCEGGLCLSWLPGGYCSERCDAEGDADTCGAGAECVSGGFRGGLCARSCTADAECRPGYECGPWSAGWGDDDGTASGDVCTASVSDEDGRSD